MIFRKMINSMTSRYLPSIRGACYQ
ncbi:Pentatricopeptide repeat superfamily protein [Prunus dulcis]|uniref:Pentatricopeptide repeat superfamily protein n=1 Tax=Prunus dulcis TaxID=3755 RepID=A0A4Y1RQL3_PRUDU|nr:Pentatricopeptide repeat superfamily protein [Prunus dulcis]